MNDRRIATRWAVGASLFALVFGGIFGRDARAQTRADCPAFLLRPPFATDPPPAARIRGYTEALRLIEADIYSALEACRDPDDSHAMPDYARLAPWPVRVAFNREGRVRWTSFDSTAEIATNWRTEPRSLRPPAWLQRHQCLARRIRNSVLPAPLRGVREVLFEFFPDISSAPTRHREMFRENAARDVLRSPVDGGAAFAHDAASRSD